MVGDDRPSSCTEGTLDEALDGGGLVTFNCHPADLPIVVTSQKVISANTQIDGGGLVTLSGGNTTHIFGVNVGLSLALNDITLGDGNVGGCDGGDIYNTGTLAITSRTLSGNGAGFGGAIYNFGAMTVAASIVALNGSAFGPNCRNDGGTNTSLGSNLSNNAACSFT